MPFTSHDAVQSALPKALGRNAARRHAAALVLLSACCAAMAQAAPAADPAPAGAGPWTITKHIDLASRYVLRGATTTYGNGAPLGNAGADAPESSRPALQWGFDAVHTSGWSVGYWASTINYSYKQLGDSYSNRTISDFQRDRSIENDVYGAYSGNFGGDLGYTVGGTAYYYINGRNANALETKFGLTYGPVSAYAQTLLKDVVWGNKGDTYLTAVYTHALPGDLTFTGTLGAYVYKKEGKYLGTRDTALGVNCAGNEAFVVNGCFAGARPKSSGLRHLTLQIGGAIPDTVLSWNLQGIIGGDNRYGIHQRNRLVATVSANF